MASFFILLASAVFLLAFHETQQAVPIQESDVKDERILNTFPRGSGALTVERSSSRGAPSLESTDTIYNKDKHNGQPIVVEEYNLLFFRVAKCASTEWTRLLMRLERNENWRSEENREKIHSPKVSGLKQLSDYPIEVAQEMMTSPNWTKAIFVRNPKSRILSAFLDKFIAHSEKKNRCKTYATRIEKSEEYLHSESYKTCQHMREHFDFFLYNITTVIYDNVHWKSCFSYVDIKWWPYMDYIANMEDLRKDAEDLLKSLKSNVDGVSAWDRAGKTGWCGNGNVHEDCMKENDAFLSIKETGHATNASNRMLKYYTPELERFVEERYEDDYNNPFFRFKSMKLFRENDDVEERKRK